MMIKKYNEFLDLKKDNLNQAEITKINEHINIFNEIKIIYDESEDDEQSQKVMEKMMSL